MWLKREDIVGFLNNYDYDVRKTGNARWIDQKCAADVLTVVSDCILQYVETIGKNDLFNSVDIWQNQYTVENVEQIFKKPNPIEAKAQNEYDKFFAQPMELLAYAKVLEKTKKGNRNYYKVGNKELLAFIALRERNSLLFLELYITKVLKDSSIYYLFEDFFNKQTKGAYEQLKHGFSSFTIANTAINGEVECNRIFIKVLNPLAFALNKRGTERGRMSGNKITYDMIMYNRDNFRDIYSEKPKDMTRKEYMEQQGITLNVTYIAYSSQKAKRIVRVFNDVFRDAKSEYDWQNDAEIATQIHHIFPESSYPEIAGHCENLIALTPNQHNIHAHPRNRTSVVCRDYQQLLLIAKAHRIEENLTDEWQEPIYEFSKFMFVLDYGLDSERFAEIDDGDYATTINEINLAYV